MTPVETLLVFMLIWLGWGLQRKLQARRQQTYLARYRFHPAIRERVRVQRPQLSDAQLNQVFDGLRQYFQLCQRTGKHMVAMPSQVVDEAWHEFILFTRAYQTFCEKGLGRFLHHTPAEAMTSPTQAQEGIRRAWRLACAQEKINPKTPDHLPLLFALDAVLGIADGFHYRLDCRAGGRDASGAGSFCGGHIGCSSGCAGDSGGASDGGDSSGCGGGCGGGGD